MRKNVEKMSYNYSPNFATRKRPASKVKYLIFHYTGMKSENGAIRKLTSENSNVSCHYFIKRNGEIIKIVPDLYIAWHAGISSWKNYRSINKHSIGIEISNAGHDNNYVKFNKNQINSIVKLSKFLIEKYKIKPKTINLVVSIFYVGGISTNLSPLLKGMKSAWQLHKKEHYYPNLLLRILFKLRVILYSIIFNKRIFI